MRKKKAFTLVEILGVVVLIGILIVGTTITVNSVWQNNRVDICESDMRDMTTSFKSYFTDYGNIIIEPDTNYETVLDEMIDVLNKKYLSFDVEISQIADDKRSVVLQSKLKQDPWNNKYLIHIYTYKGDDADNIPGLIIITSKGRDAKSSMATYADENFGDDVIAVIEPNV